VAESLTALGVYHYDGGDLRRAEREFEDAVNVARQAGPEGHPSALEAMNDLAVVRQQLGRFAEAERLLRALLDQRRRIHGDETVPVAVALGNLGTALAAMGKYRECEEMFRTAHTLFVKLLGREHVHVANATRNLARVRMFRGDYREAARLIREAVDVHRKVNGPAAGYWYMRGQSAVVTAALGQPVEAVKELRLVLNELSALGAPPARKSDMQIALGFTLLDAGRAREAETFMREALQARTKHIPLEHPSLAEAECGLGAALAAQGKREGRDMVRRSLPRYRTWGLAVYASRAAARM
jgi:tetratricopeptide (TPR) repeat protein